MDIGTVPGGSDIMRIEASTTTAIALPPGHYYARVTRESSSTSCASSNPSAEIAFTIPAP